MRSSGLRKCQNTNAMSLAFRLGTLFLASECKWEYQTRAAFFSLTLGRYYIQRRNVYHLPSRSSIEVEVHCQYHTTENASKGSLDPGFVALLIGISLATDFGSLERRERTKTMRPRAYSVARMQLALCTTTNVSNRRLTHQHPCRRRR